MKTYCLDIYHSYFVVYEIPFLQGVIFINNTQTYRRYYNETQHAYFTNELKHIMFNLDFAIENAVFRCTLMFILINYATVT